MKEDKDDALCGRMFTVENGQSNDFIMVLYVKSKELKVNIKSELFLTF